MTKRNALCLSFSIGAAIVLATPTNALATHNSWTLADNGQYCQFRDGGTLGFTRWYWEGFYNGYQPAGMYVICPVNLGGQFNSQTGSPAIQVHATVPSLNSNVYYYDASPTDSVWCKAEARSATLSLYMSQTVTGAGGTGYGTLTLSSRTGWGGTLGSATMNVAIRSFGYLCFLPKPDPTLGASGIRGYRTNICANNSQCF
ncbi:MAG TPA: hypothetical protein VFH73_24145 [Polyangia bacterium]|jgi:hypothetical protein|nr:hypothetical protein [Polyangia bacterium]